MSFDKPLIQADIDFLVDFLVSEDAPEDCLMISEINGFFAALHCGPEMIKPSEWLPVLWGGEGPEYNTMAQAGKVMSILIRMHNQVGNELRSGKQFEPLLYERPNPDGKDYIICDDWCHGFCRGMQLWKPAWDTFVDDELYKLLRPIFIAGHPERNEDLKKHMDIDELLEKLPDELPVLVMGIFDRLRPYRDKKVPHGIESENKPKIGRNDPCPCGPNQDQ